MSNTFKNQQDILDKLGIKKLNPMQEEAFHAIQSKSDVVLLSPTGTGKTLAFMLPVIAELDEAISQIQVLILVPSRELALQVEQVTREMGTGFKTNAVYGGRAGYQDKMDLKHPPAILIGTPGRVADHLRRFRFSIDNIQTLILDEFDKSLEVGFESDMREIIDALPKVRKRILTSATQDVDIPNFVGLRQPALINYLHEGLPQLEIKTICSASRNKLDTLVKVLRNIGDQPGIVFCNFKDTIQIVSDFLTENKISHGCFYGGMEQKDRERALIKFRNGTYQLIVATDLAARGIDVPEIKYIIHYQLPHSDKEFTHRNGRTARMNREGTAYVLHWNQESLPGFIVDKKPQPLQVEEIRKTANATTEKWTTLYISGGRRDKISKGDIAGLFLKQAKLNANQLGVIELKQDCAYVSVHSSKVMEAIKMTNNSKLKKKKVRVSVV
jgi:superfamily II DNA/RNA helicase